MSHWSLISFSIDLSFRRFLAPTAPTPPSPPPPLHPALYNPTALPPFPLPPSPHVSVSALPVNRSKPFCLLVQLQFLWILFYRVFHLFPASTIRLVFVDLATRNFSLSCPDLGVMQKPLASSRPCSGWNAACPECLNFHCVRSTQLLFCFELSNEILCVAKNSLGPTPIPPPLKVFTEPL